MQEAILFIEEVETENKETGKKFKYFKYSFVVNDMVVPLLVHPDYKKLTNKLVRKYYFDNE